MFQKVAGTSVDGITEILTKFIKMARFLQYHYSFSGRIISVFLLFSRTILKSSLQFVKAFQGRPWPKSPNQNFRILGSVFSLMYNIIGAIVLHNRAIDPSNHRAMEPRIQQRIQRSLEPLIHSVSMTS